MRKKLISSFFVSVLTITLTIFSVQAMYGDSGSNHPNGGIALEPGGEWKSCVSGQTAGSFPFFKRVCTSCTIKFTNWNIRNTCLKSSTGGGGTTG